jgi:putative ABC transport system substrate-binding protein
MQAASLFDGFSFDLFPPFENGLTASEVDVSRRQVVQALVVSTVVVVLDEPLDALFELSWQVVALQQDPVFHRAVISLDLGLRHRVVRQATSVIPIVLAVAGDPVNTGLVASLAHPGGNVTGLSVQQTELAGKRFELLREVVPGLRRLAIIGNPDNPSVVLEMDGAQAAARKLGLEVTRTEIRRAEDIAPAFAALKGRAEALYVCNDPLVNTNRTRINILAVGARLLTVYNWRENVEAGGLMSYGANFLDAFRRTAELIDKVLRGVKPADIPVEQPTKFDLVINLTTANALGLTAPDSLLARADEVIE